VSIFFNRRKVLPDACGRCGRVNYPRFWIMDRGSVKAFYFCRCGEVWPCWWHETCLIEKKERLAGEARG